VRSFTIGGNLRRWLRKPGCPPVLQELKRLFNKAFPPLTTPFEEDDSSMTSRQNVAYYTVTSPFGKFVYSPSSTHEGNSVILYCDPHNSARLVAGEINKIDLIKGRPRFTIQRHAPLATTVYDPFLKYPDFHARCYSPSFLSTSDVVGLDMILSHGARFRLDDNRSVILNLSRL
jgi:hypothetical protein